ncbi:hypothetical protein ACFVHW_00410 [Streptomyces sp. NPDC127110]|uniref:hypothetical protein n=1 Tax=Streptomyces sp. NPDC127110 TaxID=3345362 RepID=UPI0036251B2D
MVLTAAGALVCRVTAVLPGPGPGAPSAGGIRPGTAYAAGDGNGACLFGPSDDLMIAAMNTTDYESSRAGGACPVPSSSPTAGGAAAR